MFTASEVVIITPTESTININVGLVYVLIY
jgi:hypothetical protein